MKILTEEILLRAIEQLKNNQKENAEILDSLKKVLAYLRSAGEDLTPTQNDTK